MILAILAIGVFFVFISRIAVTCSSVIRHRQPFSEPPQVLPWQPADRREPSP